jgi:hypothetical protein
VKTREEQDETAVYESPMTHAEQVEDDIYDFVGSLAAQAPKVEIWQVNRDGRAFCDSLPYAVSATLTPTNSATWRRNARACAVRPADAPGLPPGEPALAGALTASRTDPAFSRRRA